MESCRAAEGPVSANAWRATPLPESWPSSSPLVEDVCASDGIRFLAGPLLSRAVFAMQWIFDAPPGTSVAAVRLRRHATLPGPYHASYGLQVGDRTLEQSPERGPWTFGPAEISADGLREARVAVVFGCFVDSPGCPGDGWKVVISRAAVTLADESAPQVSGVPAGRLVSGEALSGSADVRIAFEDVGGGVDTVELLIDGEPRSLRRVGGPTCVAPYVTAVPCSRRGETTMALDVDQLAAGGHRAELVLTDVAGNRTTVGPHSITVAGTGTVASDAGPASPSSKPSGDAHQAPGLLSLSGKRTRRIRFAAHKLVGTVRTPSGAALAGGKVAVSARPLRGGAWSAPTFVTAGANGRFAFTLPRGPSREVRLGYGESTQSVKLIVSAPVRLKTDRKATRNGRSVRFEGTVPGAERARTRVELQAWAGRWVPFATAALKKGRFSASYRFRSTYATTRYRFRAVVHGDDDFPYAGGTSPEVEVVVRP